MNLTGSSNVPIPKPKTLLGRLNAIRDRYRIQTSVALAALVAVTFIIAERVPVVQQFVISTSLLQYAILMILLDLSVSVYLLQRPQSTGLAKNQDESMPNLIEVLTHCRDDGADLIEYAGATTLPLIRAIRREGVPCRILVKHPETIEGLQRQRSITTLDTICNSIFEDSQESFQIRCYKLPYTLRGRRLGKGLLELGWLTPDVKRETAFGHGNPSVIADLSNHNNEHLRIFFDRTFNTLWEDEGTEDGQTVLQRLRISA